MCAESTLFCFCFCVCVWGGGGGAQINLIAPPLYVVTTVSLDKDKGVDILKKALAAIKEIITQKKGSLSVKMEPRAVTATDEAQLATMMEKYEKENTEVAGDEGDGDGDGDGGDAEGQGERRVLSLSLSPPGSHPPPYPRSLPGGRCPLIQQL